ncbi:membrane dipeptidase [Nocardia puris]|uniref:Membrane dipeptidase n=1 Tax=Nocardia puris TaxID=208602 RepID=A0A366DCH7_9NOCA|nr:membrane dipeptidase [Nocardia puris]MBF6211239.1 membrane dipeptidase [Nocardia puris]MBF6364958.1 membrane dipeptidase [Nocardia puris]MBF6458744.1 membrane dipeptidase [Nocardia puris]RBO87757.1 membrane dipeptidase [Nocardia puris]
MAPFLWEQHCCLPLLPSADIAELARYPRGSYLSVNVGYSLHDTERALALVRQFRRDALVDGRFRLVDGVDDLGDPDTIALAFDLEDSRPLGGDLANVEVFAELGVRSLLPVYNHANAAGCGCLDTDDTGLTAYGKDLVRALNEAGVFADGAHCSRRTGLDIAARTQVPMIYSHANFAGLWAHPRNITDEQARACAETGGVIGVNGVGIFLGRNGADESVERVEAMADHVQYGAELVGIDHVGIGSDYSFDGDDFNAEIAAHPEAFSEEYTKYGPLQWTPPEDLIGTDSAPGLDEVLAARGFTPAEIAAVFGGNFLRVAKQVWRG